MAKSLSKTGITTGNTVRAFHVTQSIDAFTGTEAYDIVLSGSLEVTGSITGQPGITNSLTSSYAITASHALNAGGGTSTFPFTGSAAISGTLSLDGPAGHITASGDISASGDILANKYRLQGTSVIFKRGSDNVLGNNSQPTEIEGSYIGLLNHVTASGNISASGDIIGVTGSFSHLVGNSPITVGSPVNFLSHITASGNISASATSDITAGSGSFSRIEGVNTIEDDENVGHLQIRSNDLQFYGESVKFLESGAEVISVDLSTTPKIDFAGTKGINFGNAIKVSSHITASGNISSSGAGGIFATRLITTNTAIIGTQCSAATFTGDGAALTNLQRPISNSVSTNFTASNLNSGFYFRAGGNVTCSIQSGSLVTCTPGNEYEIFQTSSAGYVLFLTGSGVTLNSKSNKIKLAGQFSAATLKKISSDPDVWDLIGDLG